MYKVITIDGIDACGKESVCAKLVDILADSNKNHLRDRNVVLNHFPIYASCMGHAITAYQHGDLGVNSSTCPAYLGAPLYSLDRIAFFDNFNKNPDQPDILVMDRSFYSNLLYFGYKIMHPMLYETKFPEVWVKNLANFIFEQIEAEFLFTGLHEHEIHRFYLELDRSVEETLKNREELDDNEKNISYLDGVKNVYHELQEPELNHALRSSLLTTIVSRCYKTNSPDLEEKFNKCIDYYLNPPTLIKIPFIEDKYARDLQFEKTAMEIANLAGFADLVESDATKLFEY